MTFACPAPAPAGGAIFAAPATPRQDGIVPSETLSLRQLNRATLARQMLLERADVPPQTAIAQLIGMQAQEPKPPFTGLWTRLASFRRDDLHRALHAREEVRGTLMRGTLHLMTAADYAAFRLTLQPMLTRSLGLLGARAEGLDAETVLPAAREILAAQPRTFTELRALLVEAFPKVNDRALGFTVRMGLPLVMIPTDDRWAFPADARFGLADDWLGDALTENDGREALVLRYLAAFGPATVADVQQWSGLAGLKPVLDALRPRLREFRDERGRALFDLPEAPRPDAATPAAPRFLPEFDNLLLAHADRTRVLPDEHRSRVLGAKNLRIPGTFLIGGFVAGTWRVTRKKRVATLEIVPFAGLERDAAQALVAEGEDLIRFLEEDAATFEVRLNEPS
jgi:hypothetical protein